jgi:ribosome maturation factor RimP
MDRDAQIAAIQNLVTPVLASLGLALFDLHLTGSGRGRTLRVVVERDQDPAHDDKGGVDLDTIAAAAQAITPLLDNEPTLSGSYLLEVTSPGVERALRRPQHFRRAVGETVSIKYRTDQGSQRCRGLLTAADDTAVTVDVDGEACRISLDDVTDAHTVFDWGPSPRPGKGGRASSTRKKEKTRS